MAPEIRPKITFHHFWPPNIIFFWWTNYNFFEEHKNTFHLSYHWALYLRRGWRKWRLSVSCESFFPKKWIFQLSLKSHNFKTMIANHILKKAKSPQFYGLKKASKRKKCSDAPFWSFFGAFWFNVNFFLKNWNSDAYISIHLEDIRTHSHIVGKPFQFSIWNGKVLKGFE